jgi:predicted XRE-type DNA-binding protein
MVDEIWKPVIGYEEKYEVSNFGQVKNLFKGILVSPSTSSGYRMVMLFKKGYKFKNKRIANLVLEAFVGPRPVGMQCCHGSRGALDDSLDNLSWDTPSNNIVRDRIRDGTFIHGEDVYNTKLTNDNVREIRRLLTTNEFYQVEIAKMFGVHPSRIADIKRDRVFKYIR